MQQDVILTVFFIKAKVITYLQMGGERNTQRTCPALVLMVSSLFFFSEYVFEHINPQVLCCPDRHIVINLGTYFGKYYIY